ncbi:MAG: hypothetical protein WC234_00385 [Endomicrobiaceae bacterium]
MKRILFISDKRFYLACFIVLLLIALFNAANFIGIWSDGVYWLCEFFDPHIHLDHGRLFTHIILHIPDFIFKFFTVINIKLLIFTHGLWAYLGIILCMAAIYKVLPEEKKKWFCFPLISYLICMIFSSYYIFNDSHLSAGLFWIIFSVYFFNDFTKISDIDSIFLLTACFISIRSYQSILFFSPLLLSIGITKFIKTKKNIPYRTKYALSVSFVFLTAAFLYGFYYTVNPTQYILGEYLASFNALGAKHFVFFICLLLLTLINKNIYAEFTVFCLFAYALFTFIVNSDLTIIYANNMRILNLIIPFLSVLFLMYLKISTIKINFEKYKAVIVLLLTVFAVNSFLFSTKINFYFRNMADYLKTAATLSKTSDFSAYLPEKYKFMAKIDKNSLFEQSIIVQILYNNTDIINSVILSDESSLENYRINRYENIIKKLNINSNINLR